MIQFLRGSKSQLESSSTIIAAGQPVFESDTGQLKIGTGSSRYSSLPYVGSIFEYDPGSGGGSSSDITWSGDLTNGYIDFPNGLRYSWLNVDMSNYGAGTNSSSSDLLYWADATQSVSLAMSDAGVSANWKSVLLDQTATMYESTNQQAFIMSYTFESDRPVNFKIASVGNNYVNRCTIRILTWSHD